MERIQFLQQRIGVLKASITHNSDLLKLIDVVRDIDPAHQALDVAEIERRIDVDQGLLAEREAELRGLL